MGLWCHAFNGHNLGDGASLDFSPCQQKAHGISFPRGYDYYSRKTASTQCTHLLLCWPPAMKPLRPALRSRSGEESGLLGSRRGSFFSRCRAGFIPSHDKSVNLLHSTQSVVNQVRLPIYMYHSGNIFTYKLDRTTVTVGALSMLVMSTSPASAGALSSA
jgi:hypothetical protein